MSDDFKIQSLRESELAALGPCGKCGKKLLEGQRGALVPFYVVTVETALTKPDALRRRVGLGLQIGDQLAQVMGPDEPLASVLPGTKFILHQMCALEMDELMSAVESVNDRRKEAAALQESAS